MPAGHMHRRYGGNKDFEALLSSFAGTLMHYWPMTDAAIVEYGPPYLVDNKGNSTTSDGSSWLNASYSHVTQDSPGSGYSAEPSCLKVGMTTGSPAPLDAFVVDCIPNAYNPGSGSNDENSAGMWTKQVNLRIENDFNQVIIDVQGQSGPSHASRWRINPSTNQIRLDHGGGAATPFSYTRPSGWVLVGFTETYDSGANTTTFKFYSNGNLVDTVVAAGDRGGLHFLGNLRDLSCTFEPAVNQDISTSYHQQGAAFILRNHAITEAQWLQLYNAGS